MNNTRPITASRQLTRLFLTLFATILVIINFLFVVTAADLIYRYADEQAEEVIETIEEDWPRNKNQETFLNAYVARQDDDAIEITDGEQKYISPKAHKIFKRIDQRNLAIKNLQLTRHGVYYLRQQKIDHNRIVKVAINVDDLIELTCWLLIVTLLINLAISIIALPIIHRLARRWTQPLTNLDNEIDAITPQSNRLKTLTVPQQPLEVRKVAQSFNHLLGRQYRTMQREKEFIANASHELKTPLAGILGHVNLIRRHGDKHPELIAKSLKYIDQEAQQMSQLINELLILEGHQTKKLTEINLSKIVFAEVESLQGAYHQKFITDLNPNISYRITKGDFQSLVHNLLENAAKYSPTNSTINVQLTADDSQIVLKVTDQGQGIAKENRQKVFERFYREDESHSNKVAGSGIGLSIVKMIIEKYHGKIMIRDNEPVGTIFTVYLPKQK
ncbi:sensor histidine kinase [Limosilactobacillus reuteri]|uniref:histidine kinase n=1 Tax=Limosilactobacillus reuteri TaxID=1598 RepID=A0AAW6JEL5_LIMRT|nr:HAMP domain-containing sensor histidine kinase [Limosilactobacillus reuteri]HJA23336.1 HAMP domain-containing histidine kinase [Candidatus Limosilactobacillus intestinavium]MCC4499538.1 HAMP domain-containing histidine kinase [Limosilactobacillus reuteri]MCC4503825.1 HAMP domain-containing histidine kinase [Limosilactobacillus reuteri]MCC4506209.1 HAMP domain-containing histidine kinase [Limosilactobacillus reuteri]MDD1382329.1 HAMP domain-containing sensor histidine kinase [Limosilactobaci